MANTYENTIMPDKTDYFFTNVSHQLIFYY